MRGCDGTELCHQLVCTRERLAQIRKPAARKPAAKRRTPAGEGLTIEMVRDLLAGVGLLPGMEEDEAEAEEAELPWPLPLSDLAEGLPAEAREEGLALGAMLAERSEGESDPQTAMRLAIQAVITSPFASR